MIYKTAYSITKKGPQNPDQSAGESPQTIWLKFRETSRIMSAIFLLSLNDFEVPLSDNNG